MKHKYTNESLHYLGLIPVLLLIVLLAVLHCSNSSATVFEPPQLLLVLNTIFVFFIACIVSLIALWTYLISGNPSILWFGSGVLALGTGALLSGWTIISWGPNVSTTIFNISVLISSMAHAIGVISSIKDKPPEADLKRRRQKLAETYSGVLAFAAILAVLSIKGLLPVFFVQGVGSTAIRDIVLMAAFVLFVITSSFMMLRFIQRRVVFLYWYSLGLALLSIAISGYIVQISVGSNIGWVSRSAQYLASIYFLISIISALLYVRTRNRDLDAVISEFFRVPGPLWQDILASVNDAVVSSDDKGKILLWNKAAEEIFGYNGSDLTGKSLNTVLPELQHGLELNGRTTEMELKRADGQSIAAEVSASKTSSSIGEISSFVIRDVTERKRAEVELRESEERFRVSAESSLDAFTVLEAVRDKTGTIVDFRWTYVNPEASRILLHPPEYLIGKRLLDVIPGNKAKSDLFDVYVRVVETGEPHDFELHYESEGIQGWFRNMTVKLRDGVAVHFSDITERKRTEELIAESLLFNRTVLATSPVGIVTFHSSGQCVSANEAAVKMIGGSLEQILTHDFRLLKSWKEGGMLEAAENALSTGQVTPLETRLISSFGNDLWVHCRFAPFQHGGEPHLLLLISDMTERKRAEDLLRNEILRLEIAQESAQAGTFEWNIQENKTIWSDQLKALYGFAPGEFKGFENWSSRVHPDDLQKSKKAILESLTTGKYDSDFRIIWPDGSLHWLAARGRVVYNEHGSPLLMTGINMDITERKRAEEALARSRDELEEKVRERTFDLSRTAEELRTSEEAYRLLVELNPVGVFRHIYDPVKKEVKRLHCNEAQLRLLGYSCLEEYLKDYPADTIRFTEDWNYYFSKVSSEGKLLSYPVRMKRKDGGIIWVILNAITRPDGDHLIIEGAMTDISEQKRIEERLRVARKQLRAMAAEIVMADERSRQHFAADLHDTVIQTIGAAKLRSQLIEDNIPPESQPLFTELQNMISQSITQARSIMSEMSPPVLYELGFVPALEWLTEQMETRHGISIEFTAPENDFQPLPHEVQIMLFQATRELLMNVVKHAKAEEAAVKVFSNDGRVRIEVTDDGQGFDKKQAFRTDQCGGGFGLFSIRERLRHFGGQLIITSKPGQGTRVVMTAPRV